MSETTERRVRQAAIELFATRGFHGTGIRDLAEAAGLSSATLYHYMGTKEDLLASIMRVSLERVLDNAARLLADVTSPVERIARLIALHVMTHAEQKLETRVVDGEIRALSESRRPEIVALRDQYEDLWQDAIDTGCREGLLRTSAPRVARLALLEMCSGISHWYSADGPLKLDDLAAHYIEMALGALGANCSIESVHSVVIDVQAVTRAP
ncbi:AcrR family transcriptional regulator [Kibdelosporangium banguiense]|uniref:AcrR family transcriptional regulator n=1 Tax=Kibdelosporangium banguiense TaxID=1365924 RepID=A0ABS4TL82_9PSEU|nr:TetR/AcrR family transcriptional regulator [Kibdelosporangium banguiense]MBP2325146.1 AcrR family transcriptional regulator [Kibdelosporangium banguiense]